jgi:hypothetical protein
MPLIDIACAGQFRAVAPLIKDEVGTAKGAIGSVPTNTSSRKLAVTNGSCLRIGKALPFAASENEAVEMMTEHRGSNSQSRAAIWFGCDAARSRRKMTASRGSRRSARSRLTAGKGCTGKRC